eukprot:3937368-Rhodomonas_salina.1
MRVVECLRVTRWPCALEPVIIGLESPYYLGSEPGIAQEIKVQIAAHLREMLAAGVMERAWSVRGERVPSDPLAEPVGHELLDFRLHLHCDFEGLSRSSDAQATAASAGICFG